MSIFWVPFLIIAGVINILAPQLSFHLSKGWMFKSAEPSELYLGVTRLIGIGLIIFSVIIIITSF
ncbi:MAG: histidine kinase [Firmicutes bacterium]|nr:histidine kinase [Bacillota bacterium]